jgi:RNA polymerase sigma-32 factor
VADVREMEQRLSARDMSFDPTPEGDDEDATYSPASYLPAPAADPAEAVEAEEWESVTNANLQSALGKLDARSRDILVSRWTGEGKSTLHELADRYQVSAERIRQIETQAMGKLKGMMAPAG